MESSSIHVENENYPKQYDVDCDDTVIGGAQRLGYNFLGWSYEGHDAPVANMVIPAHSIGDYNFVAKWQGKPHVVNLNAAGGVVSAAKVNVVFGNAYTIPVPTRLGYKFLGWYEGNSRFAENGTWNVDKDVSVVKNISADAIVKAYDLNPLDAVRLDEDGEKAVEILKKYVLKELEKI